MTRRRWFYLMMLGLMVFLNVTFMSVNRDGWRDLVVDIAAVGTAYVYPRIIPGIKGIRFTNPLLWIIIWLTDVLTQNFIIFSTHSPVIRLITSFWGLLIIIVMLDDFPEDKWKNLFSSDKVKDLVARVAAVHNVPKPSVT